MIDLVLLLLAVVAFALAGYGAKVRGIDPVRWIAIGLLLVTLIPLIDAIQAAR